MAGFPVLDVVLALTFLYLLFALTCTAVNEAVAGLFDRRARMLRQGVEHLLGDSPLADAVYQHPSVASLGKSGKTPQANNARQARPSYIPAERFAAALTDHLTGSASL